MRMDGAADEEKKKDETTRKRVQRRKRARVSGSTRALKTKNAWFRRLWWRSLLAAVWPAEAGWPHLEFGIPEVAVSVMLCVGVSTGIG